MRILFIATDYPERGKPTTGFPNYIKRVSLALRKMGHEPLILAAGRRDWYRVENEIDIWTVAVDCKDYKIPELSYVVNALKKSYALNKKADDIIKKLSVDVIQFTSLEGSAIFYKGTVPAILRLSSYAKTYYSSFQTLSPSMVGIMSLLERWSARKCKVIFAPCQITAYAFGRDCNRDVKVIETPFINDVEDYDDSYFDNYLKDKKYILFFGSLYAEKGILIIADILERFLQKNPEYYFVFAGDACSIDGEKSDNLLKRKAGKNADRVLIWSALPHEKLYPIIKGSDFVVLPSLMDNFPNACIEAMYFGKVVIGTDGASFEQLIIHGKSGLLCKIGDSEDLMKKIEQAALMTEDQKFQMGKRAQMRIERLKPDLAVNRLLRLYEYTIKNRKSTIFKGN